MTKGERAGESAIAVEVEKDKSYYWCSCGKSAKQPFVMDHIKIQILHLWHTRLKKLKNVFFVLVNKLTISHFVMDHIIKIKDKMQNLNNKVNNFFSNIDALASLFLRFGIGIAFIIHGLGKFPLPPQGLIEYLIYRLL